jgi:hypothetical protein
LKCQTVLAIGSVIVAVGKEEVAGVNGSGDTGQLFGALVVPLRMFQVVEARKSRQPAGWRSHAAGCRQNEEEDGA